MTLDHLVFKSMKHWILLYIKRARRYRRKCPTIRLQIAPTKFIKKGWSKTFHRCIWVDPASKVLFSMLGAPETCLTKRSYSKISRLRRGPTSLWTSQKDSRRSLISRLRMLRPSYNLNPVHPQDFPRKNLRRSRELVRQRQASKPKNNPL